MKILRDVIGLVFALTFIISMAAVTNGLSEDVIARDTLKGEVCNGESYASGTSDRDG